MLPVSDFSRVLNKLLYQVTLAAVATLVCSEFPFWGEETCVTSPQEKSVTQQVCGRGEGVA